MLVIVRNLLNNINPSLCSKGFLKEYALQRGLGIVCVGVVYKYFYFYNIVTFLILFVPFEPFVYKILIKVHRLA